VYLSGPLETMQLTLRRLYDLDIPVDQLASGTVPPNARARIRAVLVGLARMMTLPAAEKMIGKKPASVSPQQWIETAARTEADQKERALIAQIAQAAQAVQLQVSLDVASKQLALVTAQNAAAFNALTAKQRERLPTIKVAAASTPLGIVQAKLAAALEMRTAIALAAKGGA
jgi:hypothetical protein